MSAPEKSPYRVLEAYLARQEEKAELEARLKTFRDADERDAAAFALLVPLLQVRRFKLGYSYAPKFVRIFHSPDGMVVELEEYENLDLLAWPEPPSDVIDVEIESRGAIGKPEDEDDVIDPSFELPPDASTTLIGSEVS